MIKAGRTNFGFAWFVRSQLLLVAMLLMAWSGQSFAQAAAPVCQIQTNGAGFQWGNTNGSVGFAIDIIESVPGACPSTVSGTITMTGDGTGGASAPATWSGSVGTPVNVTVSLGPNPGQQADFDVNCTSGCSGGGTTLVQWTARTFDAWLLTPTTGQSFTAAVGQSVPLGAQYTYNGGGAGLDTFWSVGDPNGNLSFDYVSPDGAGNTTNFFWSNVPGVYTVTAQGTCPASVAPTTNCPPNPVTYTVTVEDPVLTAVQPAGGSATVPQDSAVILKVKYASASIVMDDEFIGWTVTSEPSPGAGTFTGATSGPPSRIGTSTDAAGETQVTFNVTVPGTYTVQACHESDGCLTNDDKTTFTITVSSQQADLSVTKTATPSSVAPGGQLTYSIAIQNNGPDPANQISLDDNLPAQLSFVSITTPHAWNCSTPAVGAGGNIHCDKNVMTRNGNDVITIVANVSPTATVGGTISNTATISSPADGNGANDSSTVTTAIAATAPSLSVVKLLTGTADNDSSGSTSTGDRLDYSVTATNNGNTVLHNVVVSDNHFAATQSCATLAVNASCVLSGSYIVTAADTSAGSVTNIGSATSDEASGSSSVITPVVSTEPVTLGVGSGDGQSAPVNTPFPDPLTVVAGGVPPPPVSTDGAAAKANLQALVAPGITINWLVVSGSANLQFPTTVTNASGIASNNAFAGPTPGPVVIRASRADQPSTFVEFHLTVTAPNNHFSDLPGLDANQQALAQALDEICASGSPSTSGLVASATSSSTSDLLARCDELLAAIDTDPSGVIDALDELFADIALVQSESSLLAAESQFDNIKARIAALRSGTNGTSFEGLAFRNASGTMPVGAMFKSLLAQDPPADGGTPKEVGGDFSRWGFFASGTIGRGDADQGQLSPEYDFDIDGLTVGADYRKSDKLIFGGTLGYTKQTNELSGARGSLDTKGWSMSAYGTWYQASSWYLDGILSWGQNSYDIERHVRYTITTPSGSTTIDNTGHASGDGDSLTAALSVGRDFNKGAWGFGPYLRAMYTKMDFDTLSEEFDQSLPGNGFALALDTRSVTSLTSTLGGKLTYVHSTDWGVLIPHVQLEWQHEFEDDPAQVDMRFLADPTGTPFTIHGDPVDSDFFRFGVGMSFILTKGRSGFFYYERLMSRERFAQNSLALGIRLEF